jgi:hypothetical protein
MTDRFNAFRASKLNVNVHGMKMSKAKVKKTLFTIYEGKNLHHHPFVKLQSYLECIVIMATPPPDRVGFIKIEKQF